MNEKILVIAAHPDDEVLGCGGTIVKHVEDGDEVFVLILSKGETSREKKEWDNEQRKEDLYKAAKILGVKKVHLLDFPDQRMDTVPLLNIIKSIENVIGEINPNIIYTHHGGDLNMDHQITHRATMTACRPLPESTINAIYNFEVPSSTEWASLIEPQFKPVRVCNITTQLEKKIEALKCYSKEMREFPHPRSFDAVIHSAKSRGAQFGICAAEVFSIERLIWR